MKYSNYFATHIKHSGLPNMDNDSFSKMMNIVSLEGQLLGIAKVSKEHSPQGPNRYDRHVFTLMDKLNRLTGKKEPKDVMLSLMKYHG